MDMFGLSVVIQPHFVACSFHILCETLPNSLRGGQLQICTASCGIHFAAPNPTLPAQNAQTGQMIQKHIGADPLKRYPNHRQIIASLIEIIFMTPEISQPYQSYQKLSSNIQGQKTEVLPSIKHPNWSSQWSSQNRPSSWALRSATCRTFAGPWRRSVAKPAASARQFRVGPMAAMADGKCDGTGEIFDFTLKSR